MYHPSFKLPVFAMSCQRDPPSYAYSQERTESYGISKETSSAQLERTGSVYPGTPIKSVPNPEGTMRVFRKALQASEELSRHLSVEVSILFPV
jgi:hypothetical protein